MRDHIHRQRLLTATPPKFLDALLYAAVVDGGQANVVLALCVDFYTQCTEHVQLAERLAQHQTTVTSMRHEELRDAIS